MMHLVDSQGLKEYLRIWYGKSGGGVAGGMSGGGFSGFREKRKENKRQKRKTGPGEINKKSFRQLSILYIYQ